MKLTHHSSHPRKIWTALCVLLIIVTGFTLNPEPKELSITFKESFRIEGDPGPDAEYFMPSP
ncbi:hypothetical protein [Gracilimonas mengyeensis]|uniref:hypothetical protein n=1 Tax=Gracilimonas mengyeensis TaxID=1302730 RepID=UPI001157756B|nr:hypothetical protein [Gracilimonas mengyeensis]